MSEQEKREKVIKGLGEVCAYFRSSVAAMIGGTFACDAFMRYADVAERAIALLKAQEPHTSEFISSAIECLLHPQDADDSDMAKAIDTAVRAMRLLKEQEPVKPKRVNRYIDFDGDGQAYTPETYDCGVCGNELPWKANYCPCCGKAVKWE